jgi:alkylhydroperoxidase family enzyme
MRASSKKQGLPMNASSPSAPGETPYFSEAERAALALAEAATRLSDRSEPVPDEVWNEATRHYNEPALGALVVQIALINFWNRLNATTR